MDKATFSCNISAAALQNKGCVGMKNNGRLQHVAPVQKATYGKLQQQWRSSKWGNFLQQYNRAMAVFTHTHTSST
eukprot:1147537-Pelagomonas_calceolata.AAC.2